MALATIIVYDHSFIVMACVITIVNYDPKSFIVQATGLFQKHSYMREELDRVILNLGPML
jgi:hypothetical protein